MIIAQPYGTAGSKHRLIRPVLTAVIFMMVTAVIPVSTPAQTISPCFGPDGGLHPRNRYRPAAGTALTETAPRSAAPTMDRAFIQWLDRVEDTGEIKLAIYSFSSEKLLEALIRTAWRGVRIKLLMDGTSAWKKDQIDTIMARLEAMRLEAARLNTEVPDFHLSVITRDRMIKHFRFLTIPTGNDENPKIITGSMHEKFGVAAMKRGQVPSTAFMGSANFTNSSNDVYCENRIFFSDMPSVGARFDREFARLWNLYGVPRFGACPPEEKRVTLDYGHGSPPVFFNPNRTAENSAEEIDPGAAVRPDMEQIIVQHLDMSEKGCGTVDVPSSVDMAYSIDAALFSFTRQTLADRLLQIAASHPHVQVRVLLDQHQLGRPGEKHALMGLYLERESCRRRLNNIQLHYFWKSNAFSYYEDRDLVKLDYRREVKMHHKFALINNRFLLSGSYNWTESAALRNFENFVVFDSFLDGQEEAVRRFRDEFDAMWYSTVPRSVPGATARALRKLIGEALTDPICRQIRNAAEASNGLHLNSPAMVGTFNPDTLFPALVKLIMADLVVLRASDHGLQIILRD